MKEGATSVFYCNFSFVSLHIVFHSAILFQSKSSSIPIDTWHIAEIAVGLFGSEDMVPIIMKCKRYNWTKKKISGILIWQKFSQNDNRLSLLVGTDQKKWICYYPLSYYFHEIILFIYLWSYWAEFHSIVQYEQQMLISKRFIPFFIIFLMQLTQMLFFCARHIS